MENNAWEWTSSCFLLLYHKTCKKLLGYVRLDSSYHLHMWRQDCHWLEYLKSLAYLDHPGPSKLLSRWRPFCLEQFIRLSTSTECQDSFPNPGAGKPRLCEDNGSEYERFLAYIHAPPHQKKCGCFPVTMKGHCWREMTLLLTTVSHFPRWMRQATYAAVVSCSDCKTSAEVIFDAMKLCWRN